MELKILFQDENLLVIEKPAGIIVYDLIKLLFKKFPDLKNVGSAPRHGLVHRLDKDTSGITLVARNNKALKFFQEQFKKEKVLKKYLALVVGKVKRKRGEIETLIGRAPKAKTKQKIYLALSPEAKKQGLRKAKTCWKVLQRFRDYTLLEVIPKTGRHHQIRAHLAFIHHPITGDRIYGFKNQPSPKNLQRQFLHANFLRIRTLPSARTLISSLRSKIKMPDGQEKEFKSGLPEDLKKVIEKLNE